MKKRMLKSKPAQPQYLVFYLKYAISEQFISRPAGSAQNPQELWKGVLTFTLVSRVLVSILMSKPSVCAVFRCCYFYEGKTQ